MIILVFGTVDYFHHTGYFLSHVVPAFLCRINKSESSLAEHLDLSVTVGAGSGVVHTHDFFMYS